MTAYLSLARIADMALVTPRALKKAVLAIRRGGTTTWRGSRLVVREVHGRGGRGGQQYLVRVDSLPLDLQLRWKALQAGLKGPANRDDTASIEREWRSAVIASALEHPARSPERTAAVETVARAKHYHPVRGPKKGPERVSARTVQRWITDFERGGLDCLTRRERGDKGARRIILSARWDKAVRLCDREMEDLAAETRQDLRNLWGNGAGLADVTRLASEKLAERTGLSGGFSGSPAELARACRLPRNVVEAQRKFRRVHELRTDRKAFEDRRPRIRRSTDGLAPMQLVMGDVHHCDVLLTRPDGSKATPKMIAWLDIGTGRFRCDLVLCEAGRAVRNADLIASFLAMVRDPAWGMPSTLYLDNGSEYRFAEFIRDAMKLTGCHEVNGRAELVRATAYNAAAKGKIERAFGVIERTIFAALPGYIGGDRMRSKTGNVGRAPVPFGGSFDQFADAAHGLVAYYNTRPAQAGSKTLSPSDTYHQAATAGWQRNDADDNALFMAFSETKTRKVRAGTIEVDGEVYYLDKLFSHEGETVTIRQPKYTKWNVTPVWTKQGVYLGEASPDKPFPFLAKNGAVEAARRKRVALATVRGLAKDVQPEDLAARMIASGRAADLGTPVPKSGSRIGFNDQMAAIGRAVRESPEARFDREVAARQKAQRERQALIAEHEAIIAAGAKNRALQ